MVLNFEDGREHGKCGKVTANRAHNTNFQNYKFFELEPPNKGPYGSLIKIFFYYLIKCILHSIYLTKLCGFLILHDFV
jgi:hypothetical protein